MESEKGIKSSGFPSRIWGYLTLITVEPMLFFYAMGMAMNDVTATNLMEIKICYFVKEFPACVCEHFLTDESLKMQKELVQKSLTNYNTILSVMGIPSVLWCMVIGEWSDNYGRKKPILGAILSFLLTTVGFLLCYPMGTLLGGFLFHSFHFKGTYSASIVAMSISLVYGYIRIKETRGLDNSASLKVIARDLFRISNFLEGLKTIRKKREGSKRLVLSLCLVIICLNNAFLIGTSSIQYPYTQLTFQWNVEQFSIFSATGQFFNKFVNIFITPLLSTRFHLPESAIGLIGVMSGIIAMITKVLARNVPLYYISEFLFGMFFVGTAAARSLLSQSVNGDELGKAYGFAGALEAVSTLVFIPAIQQIYKATLSFFPSFTFVVTALVTLPNLCSFLWLDMSKRRTDLRPKTEDSGERIHTIALPDDIDITAPDFPKSEKSTYL
ncbi:Solute carrier family 46 member 3 [Nymphon striatum]|nr:Solute carrier family 46 member 3 [Nymphon striatum]